MERSSVHKACRILIASGIAEERATWRSALAEQQYDVSEAENGAAAIKAIHAGDVDLVITAVTMLKMDGLELLRAAREIPSAPPIIMIARGQSEMNQIYVKTASLLGAADAYMEPLDPGELLNRVQALLRLRPKRSDYR